MQAARTKVLGLIADLSRQYSKKVTQGELRIYNGAKLIFECKTLELPWLDNKPNISCIPEGTYTVVRRYSKKYGWHLHITNVEGRKFILIHWGNYAGSLNPKTGRVDIEGCVLVGQSYADFDGDGVPEITASKNQTFHKLMQAAPDGFELTIC